MMKVRNTIFAVAVGLSICLVASVTSADVMSLTPVTVDNSAGGAELAGFVTTDFLIDFTGQYTGSQAWIQLSQGSIYQNLVNAGAGPPSAGLVAAIPAVGFDTFVAQGSPTADGPSGNPSAGGGAVDLGGPAAAQFDTAGINQAWNPAGGQPNTTDLMNFLIGRFTLSEDAQGTAQFLASAAGVRSTYELSIFNGVIVHDHPDPVLLNDLGEREWSDGVISAMAMSEVPVDAWSDLTLVTGSPAIPATLTPDGIFSWDPAGSAAGKKGSGAVVYEWSATAHLGTASDTGLAFRVTLIPEPATMSLFGLAMVACVGILHRRRQSHH